MVKFSEEAYKKFEERLNKYPYKEAAIMPTLWLAQEEFGYLSIEVMRYVGKLLDIPPAKVQSVASFYTMYKKEATGKHLIQVCQTLSCELAGGDEVIDHICQKLNIKNGGTTEDNKFSIIGVECLASCGTAPMMQINNDYYENLTRTKIDDILNSLD